MSEFDELLASVRAGNAPTAPTSSGGEDYASLLEKVRKPDPAIAESNNITASFYKPETEAQKQKLARELQSKLGEEWAPANIDPVEAQRRLKVVENDHVLRNSPKLADQFVNPQFARIAHDDVPLLGEIERTAAGTFGDIGVTALKGAVGLPQAFVGLADIPTLGYAGKGLEAVGFKFNETQKILDSMYSPAQQAANKKVRSADGFGDTLQEALANPSVIATTVGESLPQMLGGAAIGRKLLEAGGKGIAAGMAGPELPSWLMRTFGDKWAPILASAAGEGLLGAGSAAEQIRGEQDDGLLSAKQSLSALGSGVGTALFAVAGGAAASKLGIADIDTALVKGGMDMPSAELLKKGFARKFAEAGLSEGVFEELPQSVQEQMWQNFATDKPLMDGVGNAGAMGLLAGVATGGAAEGYHHVAYGLGEMRQKEIEAQQAARVGDMLAQFSKLAEASKVRERDPESAQAFFQSVLDEGRQDLYITPDALAQSGMADVLAQAIPSIAEQLATAAETGHDIRIPIADIMASVPGDQLAQSILPHLSTEPGGFTPTTAQEYMQSDKAKELEQIVNDVVGGQQDDAFKQSSANVKQAVLDNLTTAGRWTNEVNQSYATLTSSYASVRAAQLGLTPEEFFAQHMMTVQAEQMGGEQYDQSGKLITDTPNFKKWFGDSKVVDAAGNPIVFYHGTTADFDSFNANQRGVHFLSPSRTWVEKFHTNADGTVADGANVMPVYAKASNPFDFENKAHVKQLSYAASLSGAAIIQIKQGKWSRLEDRTTLAAIKSLGFDGLYVREDGHKNLAVFDPTQIKSAIGNNGNFDGTDANILHQAAFHGSPYRFDKFSLDHMGKGEGAQAYGWGLYFAGNRSIAEWYKDGLSIGGTPLDFAKSVAGDELISDVGLFDTKKSKTISEIKFAIEVLSDNAESFDYMGVANGWHPKPGVSTSEIMAEVYGDEALLSDIKGFIDDAVENMRLAKEVDREVNNEKYKSHIAHVNSAHKKIKESLVGAIVNKASSAGQLYEVEIPEDDSMLLWDKPLSEQPEAVKKSLGNVVDLLNEERGTPGSKHPDLTFSGSGIYGFVSKAMGGDEAASKYLNSLGINGIKYLDGTSRNAGEGSFNYVVFDDAAVQVLKTYYQGEAKRGSFNPETNVITLLKDADLSTFLHEGAHYFFETDIKIASQLLMQANNGEGLSAGEQHILNDVSALLTWHGIQGDATEQLRQWELMPFEERRGAHERTAESFERYLHEGKAPSIELQPYFQKFSSWLKSVYRSIKDFIAGHPEAGKLNDEVRGIFDRMLATDEQIKMAQQARSMMPLFTSPEQAATLGVLIQDWAAYQAIDKDATAAAMEELQAKGVRDMQWISNYRNRVLARLRRDSKEARIDMTAEARRQIMSQDIYRVWQFLTAKITTEDMTPEQVAQERYRKDSAAWRAARRGVEDQARAEIETIEWNNSAEGQKKYRKLKSMQKARKSFLSASSETIDAQISKRMAEWEKANVEPKKPEGEAQYKSDPNSVDESADSLFSAIAKLGGLNKSEVMGTWGTDPADKPSAKVFGKPVWRVEGGLSIDGMAEALAQYGYLTQDENGKVDLRELEEKFDAELRGNEQYSSAYVPQQAQGSAGFANPSALTAGRLSLQALGEMGLPAEVVNVLKAQKMTAKDGLDPDTLASVFGYTSGDELVRELAATEPMKDAINGLTDQLMLQEYGELATPDAIERAADKAIHNEVRARMIATELKALTDAMGTKKQTGTDKNGKPITRQVLPEAAKQFANAMIHRLLVRNIKPGQYASAEVRAAKAAEKSAKAGDLETTAAEKRNQLINLYATKAAYQAQEDVKKALEYFKRVQKPGKLPDSHFAQILSLLEKYDLKNKSLAHLDNRTAFRTWAKGQIDQGNIPPNVELLLSPEQRKAYVAEIESRNDDGELIYPNEEDQALVLAGFIDQMAVRNYKNVSVEELLGLRTAIEQIEHIGKRTKKVLTDRKNREFANLVAELTASIAEVANRTGRKSTDTVTPNNKWALDKLSFRGFFFSHVKAGNIINIMDGNEAGGPLWEALMMSANEAGNGEVLDLASAHTHVQGLLRELKVGGDITDRAQFFPTIGESLNRQARIAMAMNMGNESNQQRLLGGKGWKLEHIKPVLDTLTASDWQFVQKMWDYYESFRPRVGEMEKLINGVEPNWVQARSLEVHTADGQTLQLRGGYAPVIYDPRSSGRAATHADEKDAKAMMMAARVASTVSKSFTKARVEEVTGRPLMLSLDAFIGGIQDTIHYLHWQPWIIDANRLVKALDPVVRKHYGATVMTLLREWTGDNAAGMRPARDAAERWTTNLARNVSFVGLAFNVISAVKQVTGYTQSMVAIGSKWMGRGVARSLASPRKAYLDCLELSDFMKKRASTRMRDLAETRNTVQDQGKFRDALDKGGYAMMLAMQTAVDVPTWWGMYERAVSEGKDDHTAVMMADQAVVDAQGGGLQKDLSSIERQTGAIRLLTGFMSFMNTTMNMNYRVLRSEQSIGNKGIDLVLINTIPVILGGLLTSALTPGDGGDDEPEDIATKIAADHVGFMLGQFVGFREIQQIGFAAMGKPQGDYGGAVGLRMAGDMLKLAKQAGQGEMDDAFRKAAINAASDFLRLPGAQLNRTITGTQALVEGETDNPAAIGFGFQRPH